MNELMSLRRQIDSTNPRGRFKHVTWVVLHCWSGPPGLSHDLARSLARPFTHAYMASADATLATFKNARRHQIGSVAPAARAAVAVAAAPLCQVSQSVS